MNKNELYNELSEKMTARTEIFNGAILHVVKDDVILPNGKPAFREVALHNGAVCIVPITDNNEIIMERQFRYPFDEVLWEIPAGKIEKGETDPLEVAKRELREETGFVADKMEFIGMYYASPAILSEKIHVYIATGLKKGDQDLDADEFLDVHPLPFNQVVDMILSGEIPDGKTQAAVLKAKILLGL